MNLPTTNSTHYFVPVDGVIKLIKDMPEKPVKRESFESYAGTVYMGGDFGYEKALRKYDQALQSAIDDAVKVSNPETVIKAIQGDRYFLGMNLEDGKVYSLQCRVEMKGCEGGCQNFDKGADAILTCHDNGCQYVTALVTFDQASEPIMKEKKIAVCEMCGDTKYEGHDHTCYYSLKKEVESEPGDSEKGETQEQVFDALFCEYFDHIKSGMSGYTAVQLLKEEFVVTRKREVK